MAYGIWHYISYLVPWGKTPFYSESARWLDFIPCQFLKGGIDLEEPTAYFIQAWSPQTCSAPGVPQEEAMLVNIDPQRTLSPPDSHQSSRAVKPDTATLTHEKHLSGIGNPNDPANSPGKMFPLIPLVLMK